MGVLLFSPQHLSTLLHFVEAFLSYLYSLQFAMVILRVLSLKYAHNAMDAVNSIIALQNRSATVREEVVYLCVFSRVQFYLLPSSLVEQHFGIIGRLEKTCASKSEEFLQNTCRLKAKKARL